MEMSTKQLLGALEFGPSHHRLGGQDSETLNRLRVSATIPTISHAFPTACVDVANVCLKIAYPNFDGQTFNHHFPQ